MKRTEKEEGHRADPANAPRPNSDDNITDTISGQGVRQWYGTEHPYYALADMIEEVECMLVVGKRRKTVHNHLSRIIKFLPWFERQVACPRGRLSEVRTRLQRALSVPNTSHVDLLLEEARTILAALIVVDEDAKFSGCRNEDGELVLKGGLENEQTTTGNG